MKKTIHFLSGIPRSGSTVLAAILNQNPIMHVSTTSGLVFALDGLAKTWHSTALLHKNDPTRTKLAQTMRGAIDAFYEHTDRPIIIDKSRGWPIAEIIEAMVQVLNRQPKIIATVRSIPDCAASFVRVANPTDLDYFINTSPYMDHLYAAYTTLQDGYKFAPENFLFVEYENLLAEPKIQLARVHKFLGLSEFKYNFNNIDSSTVAEDDENLHGSLGMHDVKPVLAPQHRQDPKELLKHHYFQFVHPEFWLNPLR